MFPIKPVKNPPCKGLEEHLVTPSLQLKVCNWFIITRKLKMPFSQCAPGGEMPSFPFFINRTKGRISIIMVERR